MCLCQGKFQTLAFFTVKLLNQASRTLLIARVASSFMESLILHCDTHRHAHSKKCTFTFHCYLRHSFYHPQGWHGHTGVVGRLANICELQDVPPNGHVVFGREVLGAQHPFDIRHGRAHRHARDIDTAAWHDVIVCGWNGEAWWHSTNWKRTKGKVRVLQIISPALLLSGNNCLLENNTENITHWNTLSENSVVDGFTPTWAPCTKSTVSPMEQKSRTTQSAGRSVALFICWQRSVLVACFQLMWYDLQQHIQTSHNQR